MVELIKEKLSVTKERSEIIHLLTIVPNNFVPTEYFAKQARELRCKKGLLSVPKKRVDIPQSTEDAVLVLYESDHISHLLPGKKDCITIRLPNKTKTKVHKRLLLANISEIHKSLKDEYPDKKIVVSRPLQFCDSNGLSL